SEKGYRNVQVSVQETRDTSVQNSSILTFMIEKGQKVKISQIHFIDNTVSEDKLKSQLKGTKEKSHLTLFPSKDASIFNDTTKYRFNDYVHDWGFLSFTKTREILEPYIKIKPFS